MDPGFQLALVGNLCRGLCRSLCPILAFVDKGGDKVFDKGLLELVGGDKPSVPLCPRKRSIAIAALLGTVAAASEGRDSQIHAQYFVEMLWCGRRMALGRARPLLLPVPSRGPGSAHRLR
jgi:hypothetical protein